MKFKPGDYVIYSKLYATDTGIYMILSQRPGVLLLYLVQGCFGKEFCTYGEDFALLRPEK